MGLAPGALWEPMDLVGRSQGVVLSEAPGGTCCEFSQQERCPLSASFLISPSRGGPCSLDAVGEKWVCPTPGVTRYSLVSLSPEEDAAITG